MSESEDLYALLGVTPAATPDEIAQAYAARITASASDPPLMLRLSNAFQTLLDPSRRSQYDAARTTAPVTPFTPAAPPPAPVASPAGPAPTVPPGQWTVPGSAESPVAGSPAAGSPPAAAAPGGPDVTTRVEPPLPNAGDRTEMVAWPPVAGPDDLTQRPTVVTCPICGVSNTPGSSESSGESYCQDCGFLLSQTPGEGEVTSSAGVRLVSADGTREFALPQGTSAVGRQDAEVLLIDGTVSRLHARLYLEEGRLSIEDANSTNGSRVNGIRLEPGKRTAVSDGDEVQFGQISLRVRGASSSGTGPTGTIVETGGRAPAAAEPTGPELARLVSLPAGTVYPIYSYPAAVGRRADSAIVINDPYISGRHAELIEEGGLIAVHDLGSTNGTVVGSEMLDKGASAPLPPGGTVQFGKQRFRFESSGVEKPAGEEAAGESVEEPPAPIAGARDEPALEEGAPAIPAFGRIDSPGDAPAENVPAGSIKVNAGEAPAENTKTDKSERPAAG